MAFDTYQNQLSIFNFGSPENIVLPIPSGVTFDEGDQSTLLGLYREIELESIDRYSTKADLVCLFGIRNINEWADLDGNKNSTKIRDRTIAMMVKADDFINDRLRDGPYPIPFTSPYPRTIVNLAARLAGLFLYEHRGVTDSNEQKHDLHWHQEYVDRGLTWILSRKWRLEYSLTAVRTHIISANGYTSNSGLLLDEDTQPAPYSTRADVESIYGQTNPIKWGDLDNNRDADTINNRIIKLIDFADNEINCRLRAGPYKIPFTIQPYSGLIRDLSARLAGVLLYECRGPLPVKNRKGTDLDSDANRLLWHRNQVDKTLNGIMSRQYRLDYDKTIRRRSTPIAF